MYNIINISELDMHTHTVFSGKIWIHIGLQIITYESSLHTTSYLIYNSYVDDIIGSTTVIEEAKQFTKDIDEILKFRE